MLQVDNRLAGDPRYLLVDLPSPLMMIPDDVRKCVAFLGVRKADGSRLFAGTGFLAARKADEKYWFHYLITAKHVIEGIKSKGYANVSVRLNLKQGEAIWIDNLPLSDWFSHPSDAAVDIA